ncbi:type II secretion system F family protein [Clostridium lundense]|uniref:type II secretion system F family protein n=1 Tax=Clostridium lundense TaxID=319475 RepID=UPI0004827B56|nr:type II secretion system F family protein [Clostridium lundense]
MIRFVYKATDNNFNIIKGCIEEKSMESAIEEIKLKGLKIIYIKKKKGLSEIKIGRTTLKDELISSFCGQMAVIINTGVSILKGLEIIEEQDKKLKKAAEAVIIGVRKGETLGDSMRNSGFFPNILTDMVSSGELSGNTDEILTNMESYYQKEATMKSKVKSAAIYPSILLILTVAMMLFFNFFILGKISEIFEGNSDLPVVTIFLIKFMNYINNNFLLFIGEIIIFIMVLKYIFKIPHVKLYLDRVVLKIPVIGELKRNIITDRFSRSMAIFTKSAVPIINSLENIQLIVGNSFVSKKVENAKKEIVNGAKIADSFEKEMIFDPITIQMIRIGEETGKLESMFFKLTDIYDKKVDNGINKVMSLVEPAFTLIIGFLVGIVIIGIALPIFQMSNNIK